jgi:hypothetical protein
VEKEVNQPLREAEKLLREAAEPRVQEGLQRRRIAEATLSQREKEAAKATADRAPAMAEAEAARLELEAIQVPSRPRLLADDVTPEALADLLADRGGVLGILSSEGGLFATIAGRYNRGVPNLDVFLKAYSGDRFTVDRKSGPTVAVNNPALTMGFAVQPAVLASFAEWPDFTGRGFTDRFLYALPDTRRGELGRIGARKVKTQAVPPEIRERYQHLVLRLALEPLPPDPPELALSVEAAGLFDAWRHELEPRRDPDTGDLDAIVTWSSKLDGQTLRLAALLHLAARKGQEEAISGEAMQSAILLARYFIDHAKAAHRLMRGNAAHAQRGVAEDVLRWAQKKHLRQFSMRDAWQLLKQRKALPDVEALEEALQTLEDMGWARRLPMPPHKGRGRKPSPEWEIHPGAFEDL